MEGLKRLCFDTDILIDYLREPSEAVKLAMEEASKGEIMIYTTTINSFEVWLGAYLAPRPEEIIRETEEFLSQLRIIDFSYEASVEAGRVMADLRRKGRVIEIRNLLIGSASKVNELPLVTRNTKHYTRITGLMLLTPEDVIERLRGL